MSDEKNAYTHKQLKVWQKAMNLVIEVYNITNSFPDTEKFGLSSQMRRSVVSIPSNIAEGAGRSSDKEMIRFLDIARGSIFELDTQIEITKRLNYLSNNQELDEISRMLRGLRNSKSHNS